jgi:hypothetical protein
MDFTRSTVDGLYSSLIGALNADRHDASPGDGVVDAIMWVWRKSVGICRGASSIESDAFGSGCATAARESKDVKEVRVEMEKLPLGLPRRPAREEKSLGIAASAGGDQRRYFIEELPLEPEPGGDRPLEHAGAWGNSVAIETF